MGTTNIKLIDLAKDLLIHNFHCICKNQINQCSTNNTPINRIVNLNDSDKNVNGHWCLCFINPEQKIYYSTYGDPIPIEVKQYMMEVDDILILSSNF